MWSHLKKEMAAEPPCPSHLGQTPRPLRNSRGHGRDWCRLLPKSLWGDSPFALQGTGSGDTSWPRCGVGWRTRTCGHHRWEGHLGEAATSWALRTWGAAATGRALLPQGSLGSRADLAPAALPCPS